jgi:hypothetical protein
VRFGAGRLHPQFAVTIPQEEVAQDVDDQVSESKAHPDQ